MRIALILQRHSIHSTRWANSLVQRGHEIHFISMDQSKHPMLDKIIQHQLAFGPPWGYFLNALQLKTIIANIKPDIVHAHYASGYGTLARLSHFHPLIISVWGSDVFDFPKRSFLHRRILTENLCAADWICSTSNMMARQVSNLVDCIEGRISVVPFGIDNNIFRPMKGIRDTKKITIGTVKTMADKYGIDILINAFALLYNLIQTKESAELAEKLRLVIVGGAPANIKDDQTNTLKQLCNKLGIQDKITFVGQVDHKDVPLWLNQFDIYVALSRRESFGVAVLEASACGIPVIVSNVGGLPEVVKHEQTGFIVPKENISLASKAMYSLIKNEMLREEMGKAGRYFVEKQYDWNINVSQMEEIYSSTLDKFMKKRFRTS